MFKIKKCDIKNGSTQTQQRKGSSKLEDTLIGIIQTKTQRGKKEEKKWHQVSKMYGTI